jgi:hypothetical protein
MPSRNTHHFFKHRIVGGFVLILTYCNRIVNGKTRCGITIILAFNKEKEEWDMIGGGRTRGDKSYWHCIAREAMEESGGICGDHTNPHYQEAQTLLRENKTDFKIKLGPEEVKKFDYVDHMFSEDGAVSRITIAPFSENIDEYQISLNMSKYEKLGKNFSETTKIQHFEISDVIRFLMGKDHSLKDFYGNNVQTAERVNNMLKEIISSRYFRKCSNNMSEKFNLPNYFWNP